MNLPLKNVMSRVLFCLPFIAAVLYLQSYQGELVQNTEVQWQYLQDQEDRTFLALDVYAPSGITIQKILSQGSDITTLWRLTNYPAWYQGNEIFERVPVFKRFVHPYLPYHHDSKILFTAGNERINGRYTFLYEWNPADGRPLPKEDSIKIKYQNVGMQSSFEAERICEPRIISDDPELDDQKPLLKFRTGYPLACPKEYPGKNLNVVLNNLLPDSPLRFRLKDLQNQEYGIVLRNQEGAALDTLSGLVMWDNNQARQFFIKGQGPDQTSEMRWDGGRQALRRHLTAVIFTFYFVFICWFVGERFARWRGFSGDGVAARMVWPVFLGMALLTYVFFAVGLVGGLSFPVVFGILSALLFLGFMDEPFYRMKEILKREWGKILRHPWRAFFFVLLAWSLYKNFVYCFLPSSYVDGSGDIENSYLPNLDYYMTTHSFKTPVQNSTTGINAQTFDVLRAVMKMMAGETGVYLFSFVCLGLILAMVFLIGKDIFRINHMLIYTAVLLLVSDNLFTELVHFGKIHIPVLAFLLAALWGMCVERPKKDYLLPAVFLGLLTSQYVYFVVIGLACFLILFMELLINNKTADRRAFLRLGGALGVFLVLSVVFNLKLILEVGTYVPPGLSPAWLSDFFLKMNTPNKAYIFLDNHYIRFFYKFHGLANFGQGVTLRLILEKLFEMGKNLDFWYLLIFLPFLKGFNRGKILYMISTVLIVLLFLAIFPFAPRLSVFYCYPIVVLQFAVIDSILVRLNQTWPPKNVRLRNGIVSGLVGLILFVALFDKTGSMFNIRKAAFLGRMQNPLHREGLLGEAQRVFWGRESAYAYLQKICTDPEMFPGTVFCAHRNFDYAMLVRQYTDPDDMILAVPVRFHSRVMRPFTARHALGSVIYQRDLKKIMSDLERLNIRYLSVMPIHYRDYNPFYTPVFEENNFYKYFKLLFSYNGRNFYRIIYEGSNEEYTPSPYNVKGLPFIPMIPEMAER